jgi:hypothetical protein
VIPVYWLMRSDLPVGAKVALAALITVIGSWLLYELVVRRVGLLRPLFGLKVASRPPLAHSVAHR